MVTFSSLDFHAAHLRQSISVAINSISFRILHIHLLRFLALRNYTLKVASLLCFCLCPTASSQANLLSSLYLYLSDLCLSIFTNLMRFYAQVHSQSHYHATIIQCGIFIASADGVLTETLKLTITPFLVDTGFILSPSIYEMDHSPHWSDRIYI